MTKKFDFYQGKITLQNGPGCYKITEDPLWLLSVLPLDKKSYLEVGCATGVLSLILKLKNKDAKIKAIDIQECMINQALEHAKENNIEGIEFTKQNLFSLPNNEQYDCVFSNPPFFNDCCCDSIKDEIKGIAYLQTDIISFISKQLELVKAGGVLCFMGHISTRDDILRCFKNKVALTEIALVSCEERPAKRFIYIIEKTDSKHFKHHDINSYDEKLRKDILFLYQSLMVDYISN